MVKSCSSEPILVILLLLPGHATNIFFVFVISAQHCLNNQNSFSVPSGTLLLVLIPHLSLLPLSNLLYWFTHDLYIFRTPSFCQSLFLVFTVLSVSPKPILSFPCSLGKCFFLFSWPLLTSALPVLS